MKELYAEIAVPVAVDKLFTYSVPPELREATKLGMRVLVPFSSRTIIGLVVKLSNLRPNLPQIKEIQDVIDKEPFISLDLLKLAVWISEYYFEPIGEVLKSILIKGALTTGKRTVVLICNNIQDMKITPRQKELLNEITKHKKIRVSHLQKKLRINNINYLLNKFEQNGLIKIEQDFDKSQWKPKVESVISNTKEDKERMQRFIDESVSLLKVKRIRKQINILQELIKRGEQFVPVSKFTQEIDCSFSMIKTLEKKDIIKIQKHEIVRIVNYDLYKSSLGTQNIVLNQFQELALKEIEEAVNSSIFKVFLLHGVTGSGKTQVYIEAISKVLKSGRTAIVLVPEISLTPQIVRRFKLYFADDVAVFHSKMSVGERYDTWRLAKSGKFRVVIGPRSAVFAPLKNLGLIVVDEEQEASYKQFDQSPRYHARDVAIMRAMENKAAVILGSATPSVESYYNATIGKYKLLELPERVDKALLPKVEIVDMIVERQKKLIEYRAERKKGFKTDLVKANVKKLKYEPSIISDLLKEKIEDRIKKKEGVILLQNRRGFAPYVECLHCGHIEMCTNCNISLTYHLSKEILCCHYCGVLKQVPTICPSCKSAEIKYCGFGTQRVENELKTLFPYVKLIRMDFDTTQRKGAHDEILRKFSEGDVDILLGTQMVAKGLDFSRVTLVGVISADTQMLLPDFRAAERTFQLLTQVAGRAGRSNLPGEVVIQTDQPEHFCLRHVLTHNFKDFYLEEIAFRNELKYPPYTRLILVEFRGKREDDIIKHAQFFSELLQPHKQYFSMLGPAPAVLSKLKGNFRWHIVIKSYKEKDPTYRITHNILQSAFNKYKNSSTCKGEKVKILMDVDPVGMM